MMLKYITAWIWGLTPDRLGLALFGVQALAVAFILQDPLVAIVTQSALLLMHMTGFRQPLSGAVRFGVGAVSCFFALLWSTLFPVNDSPIHVFAPGVIRPLCWWLMGMQVFSWAAQPVGRTPSALMPIVGLGVLIVSGNIPTRSTAAGWYFFAVLSYVVLWALFYDSLSRRDAATRPPSTLPTRPGGRSMPSPGLGRGRLAWLALVLVIYTGGSIAGAAILQRYWRTIEQWLDPVARASGRSGRVGFSHHSDLGRVHLIKAGSGSVALRIHSVEAPGYMRGMAYESMQRNSWRSDTPHVDLAPSKTVPVSLRPLVDTDENYFELSPLGEQHPRLMEVWSLASTSGLLFHPLSTTAVITRSENITLDAHGGIESNDLSNEYRCVVAPTGARVEILPVYREVLKKPLAEPGVSDAAKKLARELFPEDMPLQERIAVVEKYFTGTYEYSLTVEPPSQRSPLEWFLTTKPPAHCEYFASATVAVLRAGGIPTRYVTGYVCREQNPNSDYWIARQRDAHAWCEAWIDGVGWVTVESTPAAGLPQVETLGWFSAAWDDITHRVNTVRGHIAGGGWGGLNRALAALGGLLVQTVPGQALLLAAGGWLSWRLLTFRWTRVEQGLYKTSPAHLVRALKRMDQRMARKNFHRRPSETVLQFAERLSTSPELSPAADWYRAYSDVRFNPNSPPETLALMNRGS